MKRLLGLSLGFFLWACATTTPPPKAPGKCPSQSVTVSVLSSPTINRSPQGEARPVVVRLYQLKADAKLYNASFDRIWKDDKATLVDDLVASQEVEVYPGTRTDLVFERPPAVNHVVAVGLFSSPTGRAWFSSLDLPPAPDPSQCGKPCAPEDDECESTNAKTAHLVYYVDGSKIDDGVEHLDDYPSQGKMKAKK